MRHVEERTVKMTRALCLLEVFSAACLCRDHWNEDATKAVHLAGQACEEKYLCHLTSSPSFQAIFRLGGVCRKRAVE